MHLWRVLFIDSLARSCGCKFNQHVDLYLFMKDCNTYTRTCNFHQLIHTHKKKARWCTGNHRLLRIFKRKQSRTPFFERGFGKCDNFDFVKISSFFCIFSYSLNKTGKKKLNFPFKHLIRRHQCTIILN